MTLFRLCLVVLGACTLLFLAKGASESGSSMSPSAAISTPASITDVSPLRATISSIGAAAYSSLTAGTASADSQSPLPDPPLRLPGKRRNSVAEFSKSFRNNSKDNLKRVFRTLKNPRQSIRRTALHVPLPDRQRLHDLLNIHIMNPLLDAWTSCYQIAYDSFSAASGELQRTSQTWITASERWANTQVATSTQWVQERITNSRGSADDEMRSHTEVKVWRPNREEETWWSGWYPTQTSALKSTSTLGLLQRFWRFFRWAYTITTLTLYLLLAFVGFALVLVALCLALGALVLLKRGYRRVRGLWDALLD